MTRQIQGDRERSAASRIVDDSAKDYVQGWAGSLDDVPVAVFVVRLHGGGLALADLHGLGLLHNFSVHFGLGLFLGASRLSGLVRLLGFLGLGLLLALFALAIFAGGLGRLARHGRTLGGHLLNHLDGLRLGLLVLLGRTSALAGGLNGDLDPLLDGTRQWLDHALLGLALAVLLRSGVPSLLRLVVQRAEEGHDEDARPEEPVAEDGVVERAVLQQVLEEVAVFG